MIVSVFDEVDWLSALTPVPAWAPPEIRTIIIAPHPDDESLSVGGLIRAQTLLGQEVTVVAGTDGENAYEGVTGLAEVRRVEQTNALKRLGVPGDSIIRLGLPDSNVASR